MSNERGNALIGIVIIIIVLLVGGIFFLNNYKLKIAQNAELKRQAEITQTQIIQEPTITETATSSATSTQTTTTSTTVSE